MLLVVLLPTAVRAEVAGEGEVDSENEEELKETLSDLETLPGLESDHGSLRFGLVIQAGFEAVPNQVEGRRNSFTLQRARLRLDGFFVTKNLTYLFEGDAASGAGLTVREGAPGSEVLPDEDGGEVPFLLDAKLSLRIPSLGLTFSLGRFIPKWGLIMPEKVSQLGAINYPLYVQGARGSFGPFRNVGLEAELEILDFLQAGGGVFNGGRNTWLDDNDRKDMLFYISAAPVTQLEIRASSLFKFPEIEAGIGEDGSEIEQGTETHLIPMVEARYRDYGVDVMLGFASGVVVRHEDDMRKDYDAFGLMVHAGYVLVGDWFQLIGRLEWWEPDNETPDDDQLRVTVGPQLFIKSVHAQININYIQDIYSGRLAMCENYLYQLTCEEPDLPPEAQRNAATLLIQFTLDL